MNSCLSLLLCAVGFAAALPSQTISPPGRIGDRSLRLPPGLGAGGPAVLVDLNGDGAQDLVRASGTRIEVLLQQGDGRFVRDPQQPEIDFPPPALLITALSTGLIDGDAAPDVVVGLAGADDVVLVNAAGSGQLRLPPIGLIPQLAGQAPSTRVIAVGNIDGRSGDDLLLLAEDGNGRLLLAPSQPGAPFVAAAASSLTGRAAGPQRAAAIADFDLDGDLDLACAPLGGQQVIILENVRGVFVERQTIAYPATELVAGEFGGGFGGDIVMFDSAATARPAVVLRASAPFAYTVQPLGWTLSPRSVVRGSFDRGVGSVIDDLAIIEDSGAVLVSFDLAPPQAVEGPAVRTRLLVGDLESDGDDDIVAVGIRPPDQILLSDGVGGFLATEQPAIRGPAIPSPRQVGVFAGLQPRLDPSLAVFAIGGGGNGSSLLYANRGGTRLDPSTRPGVPTFTGLRITDALSAALASQDGGDLLLLDVSQPDGVRLAVTQASGDVVDATATLWPFAGEWMVKAATGEFVDPALGVAASDDLVFADVLGNLRFYRRQLGSYRELIGAFGPATATGSVEQILVGHFDLDRHLDLCVLRSGSVELYRGTGALLPGSASTPLFVATPQPLPAGVAATRGVATDFDLDGVDDLVLATPADPVSGLSAFTSRGDGSFAPVTTAAFPRSFAGTVVDHLELLGEGERQVLILAMANGTLIKMPHAAALGPTATTAFAEPEPLPIHGSGVIVDLVVGDVDGDRDQDLVVLRENAAPFLLFNREVQISSLSIVQAGRSLELLVEADPVDLAAVFFDIGPGPVRFPLLDWGVLRVASPITLAQLQPAAGAVSTRLPLPVGLRANLRFQLALVRNAGPAGPTIQLGNLVEVAVTPF